MLRTWLPARTVHLAGLDVVGKTPGRRDKKEVYRRLLDMSSGKPIPFNTGAAIPKIGLGTCSNPDEKEHGDEVRRALRKVIPSVVSREQLFITSKLWNSSHRDRPQVVEAELDETLKQLDLIYLDLYLVHWPAAFVPGSGLFPAKSDEEVHLDTEVSLVDTWKAMIELLDTGKVKTIGVSNLNFSIAQIQGIADATGVVPAVNQIETHPLLPQDGKEKGIHTTAYSPLGNNFWGVPMLTKNVVVQESAQESRIISNFKQVELSEEDHEKVSSIGVGNARRRVAFANIGPSHELTAIIRYDIPEPYKQRCNINIVGEGIEKSAAVQVKIV
ncbi:hypothetical protein PAXRUDRAFT_10888 [Paxillus rubicundulus Ve08.2h10]|uniref:NADP-dependent oxidoreductase domain-containing protein n=1 Tax=Paxillus rubicundulus Ve08.2h10 TaxID=930991 RepID=A0A0D0DSE2_9AGAM|nr:hypothetical protein PAXRUDRAFT_10888 [Paxillus rubicundulus Ve08.2h10]